MSRPPRLIGIDVAPKKGGHLYEGNDSVVCKSPRELEAFLTKEKGNLLLAWDAPLTGCCEPEALGDFALSYRPIEKFLRKKIGRQKGVSVLPYCNCPHWTISRRILGLPRVGKYDLDAIPFEPVLRNRPPSAGKHVVEVHPAVALWLWPSMDEKTHKAVSRYKDRGLAIDDRRSACRVIRKFFCDRGEIEYTGEIKNDDQIDAIVAWLLIKRWTEGDGRIRLLGDANTGAILLPVSDDLAKEWDGFSKNRKGVTPACVA